MGYKHSVKHTNELFKQEGIERRDVGTEKYPAIRKIPGLGRFTKKGMLIYRHIGEYVYEYEYS